MHAEGSGQPLFRQEYRAQSCGGCLGLVVGVGFAALFDLAGIATTVKNWRERQEVDFGDSFLLVMGVAMTAAALYLWWGMVRGYRWRLEIAGDVLSWSTPWKRRDLPCREIEWISIAADGESAEMVVGLTGDRRASAPCGVLRGLDDFCEVLHTHYAHIQIVYNQMPTCQICGKRANPPSTKGGHLPAEVRYLCRFHRAAVEGRIQ